MKTRGKPRQVPWAFDGRSRAPTDGARRADLDFDEGSIRRLNAMAPPSERKAYLARWLERMKTELEEAVRADAVRRHLKTSLAAAPWEPVRRHIERGLTICEHLAVVTVFEERTMTVKVGRHAASGPVLVVRRVPYVARRGPRPSARVRWEVLAEHVQRDRDIAQDTRDKYNLARRRQKRRWRSRHQ